MTGLWYLLGAYLLSIVLLWGYAMRLWITHRRLQTFTPPPSHSRN
jgi:hypothetical protein